MNETEFDYTLDGTYVCSFCGGAPVDSDACPNCGEYKGIVTMREYIAWQNANEPKVRMTRV